jgi:3-dehydroquinate dehydratase-2
LKGVGIPAAEVHLTDINARESFRRISYPGMACLRSFIGMGFEGYREAIVFLKEYLKSSKKETETG